MNQTTEKTNAIVIDGQEYRYFCGGGTAEQHEAANRDFEKQLRAEGQTPPEEPSAKPAQQP